MPTVRDDSTPRASGVTQGNAILDPMSSSFPVLTPTDFIVADEIIQNSDAIADAYALSIARYCSEHGNITTYLPAQFDENDTRANMSEQAQQLIGARRRVNTERNTHTALKRLNIFFKALAFVIS